MRTVSKLALVLFAPIAIGCAPYLQAKYPLAWAAKEGDLPRVERLVSEHPSSVNQQEGRYGTTPLHQAAGARQYEIAKYLIDHGANPNARDFHQSTPLHYVSDYPIKSSPQLAEMLLQAGGDVNAQKDDRMTPLHVAAFSGRDEIVPVLLQHGANIDSQMEEGAPLWASPLLRPRKRWHCCSSGKVRM